ncbi:MAG: histidine kinase [Lachnospiraceae bacterium]|nr:histidine kinase [Lachnospiraceae bacterium]
MILEFFKDSLFFLLSYTFFIGIMLSDKYISKKNKHIFIFAIILAILNTLTDYVEFWTLLVPGHVLLRELASYTGYSVRPFLVLCFMQLCLPKKKHYIFLGLSIANLLLFFTSHFTHLGVFFSPDNAFQRGPLWGFVFIISGLGLIYILILSIKEYFSRRIRRWIIPPACVVLILYAVYSDYISMGAYPSNLSKTLVVVILQFYLFYHLDLARQYEEKMLQNQKLQLMLSQIKPHFFFNTITTIQALCSIDPKKASETLGLFATYVRQNITTTTDSLTPFSKEIEHVKTYASIESLRFPNIEVQYDIQFSDFDIATLSIQPLVENAIKHGIRSKEHGIVLISTQYNNQSIIINISDNGIGFDTSIIDELDDTHVGIHNVKNRLEILQNASMAINSSSDGTNITITIPWEN